MTQTLAELIELVEAGDEAAKEELRNLVGRKEQDAAKAARELKLKTDATLRDRYPRALRAYDRGKLQLAIDLDDAGVVEALKEQEEYLAEMGVPLEFQAAPAPTGEEGEEDVPVKATEADPAKALAGGKAASSPGAPPRDYVSEAIQGYKHGTTKADINKAHQALVLLNQNPATRARVKEITRELEAQPIVSNLI